MDGPFYYDNTLMQYEPWREKTNNLDFDQVWHKPGCTATEVG